MGRNGASFFMTQSESFYHKQYPTLILIFSMVGRAWFSRWVSKAEPPALDLAFQIWRSILSGLGRAAQGCLLQSAKIQERSSLTIVWNCECGTQHFSKQRLSKMPLEKGGYQFKLPSPRQPQLTGTQAFKTDFLLKLFCEKRMYRSWLN